MHSKWSSKLHWNVMWRLPRNKEAVKKQQVVSDRVWSDNRRIYKPPIPSRSLHVKNNFRHCASVEDFKDINRRIKILSKLREANTDVDFLCKVLCKLSREASARIPFERMKFRKYRIIHLLKLSWKRNWTLPRWWKGTKIAARNLLDDPARFVFKCTFQAVN